MRRAGRAIQRSACGFTPSPRGGAGFTLAELMVTVAIVSILAAIAIPQYQKTIRRGHRQAAKDILRTIYAGEQVYKATNGQFIPRSATDDWSVIFMDNPNAAGSPLPVTFTVTAPTADTFTATATSAGKSCTINEAKTFTGTWDIPCDQDQ